MRQETMTNEKAFLFFFAEMAKYDALPRLGGLP
jgi:hypothetical protein